MNRTNQLTKHEIQTESKSNWTISTEPVSEFVFVVNDRKYFEAC